MENNLSLVKDTFKELPNNIEAEQAVIGSILVQNETFDEINTIVSSVNFYDPMHQSIFSAIESLIYKGMLANPITLKNYFENEKDELNVPEYLVKVTKFSTPPRQAIEYSRIIYDMFVRRELIKISENTIDAAKLNALDVNGQNIIENSERLLFDYKLEREKYTKTAETFMNIYISIVIAAPMIFLMLFVIIGGTGLLSSFIGISVDVLGILIILLIVLLNLGFLLYLKFKQPVI